MKRRIIRIILGLIAIGILVFFFGGVLVKCGTPDTAPTITEAPWIIQTNTRFYYAFKVRLDSDSTPIIQGYWTFDGQHFDYYPGELEFYPSVFGKVSVITRK